MTYNTSPPPPPATQPTATSTPLAKPPHPGQITIYSKPSSSSPAVVIGCAGIDSTDPTQDTCATADRANYTAYTRLHDLYHTKS